MMRAISFALDVLRYPVAICVLIGLAGVFMAGGDGEFIRVIKLIASGIIINGAALFALIWLWRRMQARKAAEKGDL